MKEILIKKDYIELFLNKNNLSQRDFSYELKMTSGYVSQILSRKRKCSGKTRLNVLNVLNVLNIEQKIEKLLFGIKIEHLTHDSLDELQQKIREIKEYDKIDFDDVFEII